MNLHFIKMHHYDPSDRVFTQAWKASIRSLQSSAPFSLTLKHKTGCTKTESPPYYSLARISGQKLHNVNTEMCEINEHRGCYIS